MTLAAAALSALAGCGLFKPDTPQAPGASLPPIALLYGTPDQTLATFAAAVEAKGGSNGLTAYSRALADSLTGTDACEFRALFDAVVYHSITNPIVAPDGWDRTHEVPSFYQSFARIRPESYVFTWRDSSAFPDQLDATTATLWRHYQVQAVPTSGEPITIAIGIVYPLELTNTATGWKICRWQDNVDPAVGPNPPGGDALSMGARRLLNP
ncbi:MAG TPA: hypothetical protein VFK69_04145 [Candidatus Eisenbacteria bacterium]|nr:hypothetical protein [Candidatus Eisenbacteria bacterium]